MDRISTQTYWIMLNVLGFAWCGMFLLLDFDILHFCVGQKHWI
jgi:hypothetical protein